MSSILLFLLRLKLFELLCEARNLALDHFTSLPCVNHGDIMVIHGDIMRYLVIVMSLNGMWKPVETSGNQWKPVETSGNQFFNMNRG